MLEGKPQQSLFTRLSDRIQRVKNVVIESFGNDRRQPVPSDWFTEQEVSGLFRADGGGLQAVDEQSWHDLDMAEYLRTVGRNASLLALQSLYLRLRRGPGTQQVNTGALLQRQSPQALRQLLHRADASRSALRHTRDDVTSLLFHDEVIAVPGWAAQLKWAPWLLTAVWALQWALDADPALSLLATLAYLGLVGFVHARLYASLQRWRQYRSGLLAMLLAARDWARVGSESNAGVAVTLNSPLAAQADNVERLVGRLMGRWYDRLPAVAEYANLLAMSEFSGLKSAVASIDEVGAQLRALYAAVADAEASLCFIEHVLTMDRFCVAEFVETAPAQPVADLTLTQVVSPLFPMAEPLDLSMDDRGVLLTGHNGIGKSTFLRTVGVNLIVAKAFGVCYAGKARIPRVTVWASIHSKDSLADRQSLYMAELKRAEQLVQVATHSGRAAFFLIDEIFRGTNNLESVSAASAVLRHLATHARLLVTTHHLVLAKLLDDVCRPMHLLRAADGGIALQDGLLTETNGLALMERYAFPASVIAEAQRVSRWYAGDMRTPAAPARLTSAC